MFGITLTAERTDMNPGMDPEGARSMDHWKVKLQCGHRSMTLVYSMGFGHGGRAPKVEEVLECLVLDSSCPETFEDFCSEYGYSEDSRSAHRTWKACMSQSRRFLRFVGPELLEKLQSVSW